MPALGDDYTVEFALKDATNEIGRFRVGIPALNAGSIVGTLAGVDSLKTALAAITLGTIHQVAWGDRDTESNAVPTEAAAQRENKLLIVYEDNVTEQRHTVTIPTVDFDELVFLPGGGDAVAFTAANGATAAMQAFVTAFEALVVDRVTGNATEILEMRYVGRTS
jgi:hypothetical protein